MKKATPKPQTVNILGLTYEIERSSSNDTYGHIDFEKQKITIDKNITDDHAKLTLLHEIVHGILYGASFSKEGDDETLVQAIANGLFGIIKDNPRLLTEPLAVA